MRLNTDLNGVISLKACQTKNKKSEKKIIWNVHHISLSDAQKLKLLTVYRKENRLIDCLQRMGAPQKPLLQQTMKHTWIVKAASYVTIGFQDDRNNNYVKNMLEFNHRNIINIKLYLNFEVYLCGNLNVNFD